MIFIKQNNLFKPVFQSDVDEWNKLRSDVQYIAKISKVRDQSDIRLFKKYWALCRLVCDQLEEFFDQEDVSDWFKLKCKLIKVIEQRDGHLYFKPKSIAWENMPPEQFEMYWNRFVQIACDKLNCTEYDINENLVF